MEQNQVDTDITIGWENPEESGVDGTVPAFGSINSFPYKNIGYDDTYGVYRAVGADGKTYTSTDMLTWNNNTPDANANVDILGFDSVGGHFCYSGYNIGGSGAKYFDGTNWQTIRSGTTNIIAYFKGYWYVASPGTLYRSNVINSGYSSLGPTTDYLFAFDDDIMSINRTPPNTSYVSIDGTNFTSVPGAHVIAISFKGKYYLFDDAAKVYESDNWVREAEGPQDFVEIKPQLPVPMGNIPEILIEKGDIKVHIPVAINRQDLRTVIQSLGWQL